MRRAVIYAAAAWSGLGVCFGQARVAEIAITPPRAPAGIRTGFAPATNWSHGMSQIGGTGAAKQPPRTSLPLIAPADGIGKPAEKASILDRASDHASQPGTSPNRDAAFPQLHKLALADSEAAPIPGEDIFDGSKHNDSAGGAQPDGGRSEPLNRLTIEGLTLITDGTAAYQDERRRIRRRFLPLTLGSPLASSLYTRRQQAASGLFPPVLTIWKAVCHGWDALMRWRQGRPAAALAETDAGLAVVKPQGISASEKSLLDIQSRRRQQEITVNARPDYHWIKEWRTHFYYPLRTALGVYADSLAIKRHWSHEGHLTLEQAEQLCSFALSPILRMAWDVSTKNIEPALANLIYVYRFLEIAPGMESHLALLKELLLWGRPTLVGAALDALTHLVSRELFRGAEIRRQRRQFKLSEAVLISGLGGLLENLKSDRPELAPFAAKIETIQALLSVLYDDERAGEELLGDTEGLPQLLIKLEGRLTDSSGRPVVGYWEKPVGKFMNGFVVIPETPRPDSSYTIAMDAIRVLWGVLQMGSASDAAMRNLLSALERTRLPAIIQEMASNAESDQMKREAAAIMDLHESLHSRSEGLSEAVGSVPSQEKADLKTAAKSKRQQSL